MSTYHVDLKVTNPDGQSFTLSGAFEAVKGPLVTSVSPASGPATGGTAVTIAGAEFVAGATVEFGGHPAASVVVVDDQTITCVTPAV